jgi:hypothetical protein
LAAWTVKLPVISAMPPDAVGVVLRIYLRIGLHLAVEHEAKVCGTP